MQGLNVEISGLWSDTGAQAPLVMFDRVENIVGQEVVKCWLPVLSPVTSIFSFSHNSFNRLLPQGRSKAWLYGKRLTLSLPNK